MIDGSRTGSPEEAYGRLAAWVLPAPGHPVWRLEGEFTPAFPAAGAGDESSLAAPGARGESAAARPRGRSPVARCAPALELVKVAQTLGKLDDLAARAAAIAVERGDSAALFEAVGDRLKA